MPELGGTLDGLLKEFRKKAGEDVGSYGGGEYEMERIPTGMFPLDLALGGGFPRGKCSVIFGPESSGKTNIALLAIKSHQLLWPDLKCVFFDVEGEYNKAWAKALGVDVDRLLVLRPTLAEELVDMCESVLYAEDAGLVVIDSLAALVTTAEADRSAEVANVGGATQTIGKLCRKTMLALREAEKKGRKPSLFYINQIRHKIGVMFGDPETMPGGNAPRFQAAMWLRVYGKNIVDTKISKVLPVRKEISFILKKWKCPILSMNGKLEMITIAHTGLKPGEVKDFNTLCHYLKAMQLMVKKEKGGGWSILGEDYKTIEEFGKALDGDPKWSTDVRVALIAKIVDGSTTLDEHEGEPEDV